MCELATEKVCLARKNGLALQCEVSDLAERVLQLNDGREIIAGARFKNLDINFPFIEVCKTFELTPELLSELQTKLWSEFKNLRPKGFKFKDKPGIYPALERWSHTVFGSIETKSGETSNPGLHFDFSKALDWHPKYVEEYHERLKEKQELAGFVRIGGLDEFEEAVSHDGLLLVTDNSGFAGVIAGIKSPLYGLPAMYMIESYLSKRWIGKKVAPLAHRHFLNGVASHKYVWGTIYDQNTSSLRTALRTGRKIIETEYFLPIVVEG